MDLIDVDRLRCQSVSTVLAELIIVPDIIIRIIDDGRIIRSGLEMSCEGVPLLIYPVVSTDYSVLIAVPLLCIRNLLFPNAGLSKHKHLAVVGIPVVEITHNADHTCIRSPNAEYEALPVLILIWMSAEELIAHIVLALVK